MFKDVLKTLMKIIWNKKNVLKSVKKQINKNLKKLIFIFWVHLIICSHDQIKVNFVEQNMSVKLTRIWGVEPNSERKLFFQITILVNEVLSILKNGDEYTEKRFQEDI